MEQVSLSCQRAHLLSLLLVEQCERFSANTGRYANSISLGQLGRELLTIEGSGRRVLLELVVCLQIGPMGRL